ncbi:hypothetical protein ACFL27_23490 [candidate division CSSED10-310 bacterium]|uniref:Uncharacterized protein n=1 Tax=candidate division CSSED10-310 bacterium TaxID=2855610 RepID=A0ABV6Z410_UNCC1
MLIFAETFHLLGDIPKMGAMGRVLLPDWLGVKPGIIILGVVIMALAGFTGAEYVERRLANKGV